MTTHIKERIARKLDSLTDERLYQVLDYVEFLESRYAVRQNPEPNVLQKFAEGVEDKLRAGRVSASTIAETMGLLNRAVGVLNGVAAAGKSVATDLAAAAQRVGNDVVATVNSTTTTSGPASAGETPGAAPAQPAPPPPQTPPSTPNSGEPAA